MMKIAYLATGQLLVIAVSSVKKKCSEVQATSKCVFLMPCRRAGQHFVKFVNMLMNDTTFLLDESMVTLKSIRELQELMDNAAEWNKLNRVGGV
jgi:hypothetical protein